MDVMLRYRHLSLIRIRPATSITHGDFLHMEGSQNSSIRLGRETRSMSRDESMR